MATSTGVHESIQKLDPLIMAQKKIYLGQQLQHTQQQAASGQYVDLDGETYYQIADYDQMKDFFISVVSDSNHWMFISSRGGLSAGRVNSANALFPYYSDDKVNDGSSHTGSRTIALVTKEGKTSLWEPFSSAYAGIYQTSRNLYKNVYGDKLVFEEINHDLGVSFRYAWRTSDQFGFIKTSTLTNHNASDVSVECVDGIENILPYGVEPDVQNSLSCLVDAYKKNELQADCGLGLYTMSSILVDRAEPSEALSATAVWSIGLAQSQKLISSIQLDKFRRGKGIEQESDIRGRRGAYFIHDTIALAANSQRQWSIIADINLGPAAIKNLMGRINNEPNLIDEIEADIVAGSSNLSRIVGIADGLQVTEDKLSANHHFANVLFNVMRGGLFVDNYTVPRADFIEFVQRFNIDVYAQCEAFLNRLDDTFHYSDLIKAAANEDNADLQRLCYEYLPLSFSRRHGDPSRPWNKFSINVKQDDGSQLLDFEGNWRDIFQNWEALSFSIPNYIESMICKFVNATTADGYNPYRITKSGIDWEKTDPTDPWANIGYWGDHQIIYLLKFLEFSNNHHPGTLQDFLSRDLFCYANVPYRIKPYSALLDDPHNTIDFDEDLDTLIEQRVGQVGADGRLLWNKDNAVYTVNLTEKLLASALCKLSNFVPEGGIWMNTQRPEWNDANNALVGFGISMVTLYYTRRFQQYLLTLFSDAPFSQVSLSVEVAGLLTSIHTTFAEHQSLLSNQFTDVQRKTMLDQLGEAASKFREGIYAHSFSGEKVSVDRQDIIAFCALSLEFIDHTIRANRRDDGLYHAYNLMKTNDSSASIGYLYEMLEGQVAILSSGYLNPKEALSVLRALRQSAIYTARQHTYLLYPDRELSRFVDKNCIPPEAVKQSALLTALLDANDRSLIEQDQHGGYHFNGSFNNIDSAKAVLPLLAARGFGELIEKETSLLEDIFEQVFNHRQFTGRSGGMYAYEGLGSIYWHMVSKLLLAALENIQRAVAQHCDEEIIHQLADCYFDIRAGIGFNKTPADYGAFPTDPYSHTPGFAGAKQPGMTGQVKEEVITRLIELGVSVSAGCIYFNPFILRQSEFLNQDDRLDYFNVQGEPCHEALSVGQLGFTYCQVPIIYHIADTTAITIAFADGRTTQIDGDAIDATTSQSIFDKKGQVVKINVGLKPPLN